MKKCEKVPKSVKYYEMILPFSCCPLVFPRKLLVHNRVVFQKGGLGRMLPWNESRNEDTFKRSPGTTTGTRVRSHVPLNENRNDGAFAKTTLLRNQSPLEE